MSEIVLEAAVTTVEEARRAAIAGSDRLELCSAIEVGGVTPSAGTFLDVREAVSIPVWVLIRPRPGGFHYWPGELATMKRDAEWFLNHGADGIVVGALTAERQVDRAPCEEWLRLASGNAAFHRAFDFIPDRLAALEVLIEMGFRRILTSGGAATAFEGADEIAALIRAARGRIEILPGGGIGPENASELIPRTGCTQIHGSFRGASSEVGLQMGESRTLDEQRVRELRTQLDSLRPVNATS